MNMFNSTRTYEEFLKSMAACGYSEHTIADYRVEINWLVKNQCSGISSYDEAFELRIASKRPGFDASEIKAKYNVLNRFAICGEFSSHNTGASGVHQVIEMGLSHNPAQENNAYSMLLPSFRKIIDRYVETSIQKGINQYIEMKHLAGLKFIDQEVHLQHFDHYLYYSGYEGTALTKDILFPFIYDQGESEYTMHTKENLFLDFSKYIVGKGHYAYTFAPIYKFHSNHYVPHIYTRDERKKFLQAVDNYPVRNCSNRHIMDPVFFRIIIGTGCRLSEVLHLKISDYDRSAGAIRVMHSKNYRSRIVPLCDSLNKRVCEYIDTFHDGSDEDTYLFPGKNGSLSTTAAYIHFRDYLFLAGIPHTGDGPRIHDFRHTLAVENLRRWSQQRKDLTILLPYLAAYMGHVDTSATQYYLRLTAEIYPELLEQMEDACLNIIPEGGYTGEE